MNGMVIAACAGWRFLRTTCVVHCTSRHCSPATSEWLPVRGLLPAHATVAFALLPVNCPDLRYPRSGIIMAFLAHLHTCMDQRQGRGRPGHPTRLDTSHPGPPMRPRIMEPRATRRLVWVAWVGQEEEGKQVDREARPEQSLVVVGWSDLRGMMSCGKPPVHAAPTQIGSSMQA
jgi:hypothetical protein